MPAGTNDPPFYDEIANDGLLAVARHANWGGAIVREG